MVAWFEASELTVTILQVTLFLSQLHLEGNLISPEDVTVCLQYCRMTKHLRVEFGINNIILLNSILLSARFML